MQNHNKPQSYYPFMDTFRGVAILWILAHHIRAFFDITLLSPVGSPLYPLLYRLTKIGYLGVDIFFVLSGFLITGVLIENFNAQIKLKRFYLRRFFKIVPHYFVAILTGLILYRVFEPAGFKSLETSQILSQFVFLQNYVPTIPTLEHGWALAIEAHFYLIYALFISGFFYIQKDPINRKKSLIFFLLTAIIIVNIKRYLFPAIQIVDPPTFQMTFYRIDALLFGCLLKLCEPFFQKKRESAKFTPFFLLLTGILIYGFFTMFLIYGAQKYWYTYLLAYLAPGCFLVAALLGLDKFLNFKILQKIGKYSYSTYLRHYPIGFSVNRLFPSLSQGVRMLIYVLFSIGAGFIFTETIEKYFLKLRKKMSS